MTLLRLPPKLEVFMKDTSDWLSNLSLRASYGAQGNDQVGYYAYQALARNDKLDSQSDVSFINSSCMIFQDAPTDQKVPQR